MRIKITDIITMTVTNAIVTPMISTTRLVSFDSFLFPSTGVIGELSAVVSSVRFAEVVFSSDVLNLVPETR